MFESRLNRGLFGMLSSADLSSSDPSVSELTFFTSNSLLDPDDIVQNT